ncbi:MAG TPA: hypothetical protein VIM02_06800 [Rhizomicrobium sp.]
MEIGSPYIAIVEELVARRLGGAVHHLDAEAVHSARQNRCYLKHRLETSQGHEILAFSKGGAAFKVNDPLERFLSDVSSDAFAVPKFFGSAESDGLTVAVWSYVSGPRVKRFHHLARADLCRVVRAVGAMNALTDEARRRLPELRLRGVEVVAAGRLKQALKEFDDSESGALLAEVESYEAAADRTQRRLGEINTRVFSHQDIVGRNIVLPDSDPPIFIDWENASFAVPGSCLRRFCLLDLALQKELAAHYVAFMADKGQILNPEDVLFVMGAAQIQAALRQGLKRRKITLLRWALAAVKTYLQ